MSGNRWNDLFGKSYLRSQVMEAKLGTGDSLRIYDGGSTADMHVEITSDPNVDWDRFYRFLFSSGNRALVTLDTASHTENAGFQLKVSLGKKSKELCGVSAMQDHDIARTGEGSNELVNLGALKSSLYIKPHIFKCMVKIFCAEFQRVPLKFHTKYLSHTLKDAIFIHC